MKRGVLKSSLIQNLKSVYEAITPEEIKGTEVFNVSMEVFIWALEEFCAPSIDIHESFNDSFFKEEFFKTYNGALWSQIEDLKSDTRFFEQNQEFMLQNQGKDIIDKTIINEPWNRLSRQELTAFRQFFEQSGLSKGIEFVYNWIGNHSAEKALPLRIDEVSPFELEIEGSLAWTVYDYFVRVLQHPLGFLYSYQRVMQIDLDLGANIDHYFNTNNEFQLTPDQIDNIGPNPDSYFQNPNNPFLPQTLSSQDFPDFLEFNSKQVFSFTKLILRVQDHSNSVHKSYDFLKELDYNLEYVGTQPDYNAVNIIDYVVISLPTSLEKIFYLDNGRKLSVIEDYPYQVTTAHYYDELGVERVALGYNEYVQLLDEDIEFESSEQYTNVLDFESYQDAQYAQEEYLDEMPVTDGDEADGSREDIQSIDFYDIPGNRKPIQFDFLPIEVNVSSGTPYNNDVNDFKTSQLGSYSPAEDWKNQYFDMNLPSREKEKSGEQFQSVDTDLWFSGLDYDPWQLYEIPEHPLYGMWTKDENKFKFIGQDSGRPVNIGDPGINIDSRGVRKFYSIPGFEKVLPKSNSPYYPQQIGNLELDRTYWQPIGDYSIQESQYIHGVNDSSLIITTDINGNIGDDCPVNLSVTNGTLDANGTSDLNCSTYFFVSATELMVGEGSYEMIESSQFHTFEESVRTGQIENIFTSGNNFLSMQYVNNEYVLNVQTNSGVIGDTCLTSLSVVQDGDGHMLTSSGTPADQSCLTHFYLDENDVIQLHDESWANVEGDWTGGSVYWFELPKKRIGDNSKYTFYRGISPRQEEYNYMYFEPIKNGNQDPVNLQYRTLESFEIISE